MSHPIRTVGDIAPPTVTALTVDGSTLTLTLSEALSSVIPATTRFRVLVGGATRTVSSAAVNTANNTVTLNLASAVSAGQSVKLAYRDLTRRNDISGIIQDVAGNDLATFSARAVSNSTPSGTAWWSGGRFNELWGFNQSSDKDIDAPEAFASWGSPSGGISDLGIPQNLVAVLDTGIRGTHQDLADNYAGGYDFIDNDNNPSDIQGHGTHVAGTIAAAANEFGVVGANPVARLLAVKVLDDNGSGSTSGLVSGINYAVASGAKVLSMSLGFSPGVFPGVALGNALAAAGSAGVLSVIAAGNDDNDNDLNPSYPASYPYDSVIAVAASDSSDSKSWFSSYGANSVDVYAPGSNILSTSSSSDSSYRYLSGTSMATPLVAGIASAYWARNPSLSALQVKSKIMESIDPLPFARNTVTGGRINMAKVFGANPSLPEELNSLTDPLTGNTSSRLSGSLSFGPYQNLQSQTLPNVNNPSNTNNLRKSLVSNADNIILFFSGSKLEMSTDARSIDRMIDQDKKVFSSFNEFDRMRALDDSLGILSLDDNSQLGAISLGLNEMLSKGLISGFEFDSRIELI